MSDSEKPKKDPDVKQKFVVRTPTDVQRIKLQKLMDNPTKEIIIQPLHARKSSDLSAAGVPSFVRNVMGSSAGAGSGEFHVYRHLRRKEFARQKQIEQKSKTEEMDDAFENKLLQNKLLAENKTAKKRAKRLKQKEKAKQRKLTPKSAEANEKSESSDDDSDDENDANDVPSAGENVNLEAKEAGNDTNVKPNDSRNVAVGSINEQNDNIDVDAAKNEDNGKQQQSDLDEQASS